MDRETAVMRGAQTVLHQAPGLSREEALVIGEAIASVVMYTLEAASDDSPADTTDLIDMAQEAARDWLERNCAWE